MLKSVLKIVEIVVMDKVIVITGYIHGEELSALWNYTDDRYNLIGEITELLEANGLSSDIDDSLEWLIEEEEITEEKADEFRKLLPKIGDGTDDLSEAEYPEELSEIKIINYSVVEAFNLPA